MLSLGYLLTGALAIAPDAANAAQSGVNPAAQENNRIAQVRQSLGIKAMSGDLAPPPGPVKEQWNALKIGGTSLSKMRFL